MAWEGKTVEVAVMDVPTTWGLVFERERLVVELTIMLIPLKVASDDPPCPGGWVWKSFTDPV